MWWYVDGALNLLSDLVELAGVVVVNARRDKAGGFIGFRIGRFR